MGWNIFKKRGKARPSRLAASGRRVTGVGPELPGAVKFAIVAGVVAVEVAAGRCSSTTTSGRRSFSRCATCGRG